MVWFVCKFKTTDRGQILKKFWLLFRCHEKKNISRFFPFDSWKQNKCIIWYPKKCCRWFEPFFDPWVSSYLLLSSHSFRVPQITHDISFFRYKVQSFRSIDFLPTIYSHSWFLEKFFLLFYYFDVNKFTKFYHFHFKRNKNEHKTKKQNEGNNHNKWRGSLEKCILFGGFFFCIVFRWFTLN